MCYFLYAVQKYYLVFMYSLLGMQCVIVSHIDICIIDGKPWVVVHYSGSKESRLNRLCMEWRGCNKWVAHCVKEYLFWILLVWLFK